MAGGTASARWDLSADVEALAWCPHLPTTFLVSSEDGVVTAYDARGGTGMKVAMCMPLFLYPCATWRSSSSSRNPLVTTRAAPLSSFTRLT